MHRPINDSGRYYRGVAGKRQYDCSVCRRNELIILKGGSFVEDRWHTRSSNSSGYSVLWWSPRHTKYVKDLSLISALDQRALCDLLSVLASYDIFVQTSLIESVPLLASKQAHAAVENVVASEVDQRGAHLSPGYEQEIDATPLSLPRETAGSVPLGAIA